MSKLMIKELVSNYTDADKAVDAARDALDAAMKKRSDSVKAIHDECGKGPFIINGETVTVMKKSYGGEKDPITGKKVNREGVTYFFKSIGAAPVELG